MTDTTLYDTLSEILQHHKETLEKLLLEGLASPMEELPANEWQQLCAEMYARLEHG